MIKPTPKHLNLHVAGLSLGVFDLVVAEIVDLCEV